MAAQVAEAVCLEQLSYHEAWELSYFGANVLHPRTTLPAMKFRRVNPHSCVAHDLRLTLGAPAALSQTDSLLPSLQSPLAAVKDAHANRTAAGLQPMHSTSR